MRERRNVRHWSELIRTYLKAAARVSLLNDGEQLRPFSRRCRNRSQW